MSDKMRVISPEGLQLRATSGVSRHLDTLEGKTIGEVYNNHFKGELMFRDLSPVVQGKVSGHQDHSVRPVSDRLRRRRSGVAEKDRQGHRGAREGVGRRCDHHRQRRVRDLHSVLGEAGSRSRESGHSQRGGHHHRIYDHREGGGQGRRHRGSAGRRVSGRGGRASRSAGREKCRERAVRSHRQRADASRARATTRHARQARSRARERHRLSKARSTRSTTTSSASSGRMNCRSFRRRWSGSKHSSSTRSARRTSRSPCCRRPTWRRCRGISPRTR